MNKIHFLGLQALWSRIFVSTVLVAAMLLSLSACTDLFDNRIPSINSRQTNASDFASSPDPGLLLLMVPQGHTLTDPLVTAWLDAASELGVRIQPITDRQFKNLGTAALGYAGLILPDQLFMVADNTLIKSVRDYTQAGGQTLLVYDFGTLTLDFNLRPIYPIPKARLSDLAGVNYAMYDTLRDKSIAVGSIAATRSTLRELQVPPGKSSPYIAPAHFTNAAAATSTGPTVSPNITTPANVLSLNSAQLTRYAPADNPQEGTDALESYSGYLLGNLIYPSFVTHGTLLAPHWQCLPRPAW